MCGGKQYSIMKSEVMWTIFSQPIADKFWDLHTPLYPPLLTNPSQLQAGAQDISPAKQASITSPSPSVEFLKRRFPMCKINFLMFICSQGWG